MAKHGEAPRRGMRPDDFFWSEREATARAIGSEVGSPNRSMLANATLFEAGCSVGGIRSDASSRTRPWRDSRVQGLLRTEHVAQARGTDRSRFPQRRGGVARRLPHAPDTGEGGRRSGEPGCSASESPARRISGGDNRSRRSEGSPLETRQRFGRFRFARHRARAEPVRARSAGAFQSGGCGSPSPRHIVEVRSRERHAYLPTASRSTRSRILPRRSASR